MIRRGRGQDEIGREGKKRRDEVAHRENREICPQLKFWLINSFLHRYPSLSLHGIQGAFSDAGAKTVIPRKVRSCHHYVTIASVYDISSDF